MNATKPTQGSGMILRLHWLDILKGLAIIAVVVDHTKLAVRPFSIYSVSMFFLILGFNAYNSIERHGDTSVIGRLKSCSRFIILYIIATIIYCISNSQFDPQKIYESVAYFSASSPLYFCAIYIQITLISGFLYSLINRVCGESRTSTRSLLAGLALLAAFYIISYFLRHIVIFPNLHGGGKYLFGSTYLFLTLLGMLFARMAGQIEGRRGVVFYLSLLVLAASPLYIGHIWSNPPIFMTCVYAASIFLVIASLGLKWENAAARLVMTLGKYSVHIFMYHLLVMEYLGTRSKHVTFVIALLVPVLIGVILDKSLERKKIGSIP